jgi:hypothetical protein
MVKSEIWYVNMKFDTIVLYKLILWSNMGLNGAKCKNAWKIKKRARNDEYDNTWTILTTNCPIIN